MTRFRRRADESVRSTLRRVILLALLGAVAGYGQYTYDSNDSWYNATIGSRWAQNGSFAFTYPYATSSNFLTFAGTGGSLIDVTAISGANANDYDVNSTLALKSGGGTYIHFFRTGASTAQAGSGTYFSAEIVMPSTFSGSGAATLNINQAVSGTVTQLASASITATDGMIFRTVMFGSNLWIFCQ